MADDVITHSRRPPVGVVVPAAGAGARLGARGPEALIPLAGRPLLCHVLTDLEATACAAAVVVAAHPAAVDSVTVLVRQHRFGKVTAVVPGGDTRQASVAAGLRALPPDLAHVAVHDAARPLAGPGLLDRLLDSLLNHPTEGPDGCCGVVPGLPVTDTVREVDPAGLSKGLVPRELLRGLQTPQLFVRAVLERAHTLAAATGFEGRDDATLVERAGETFRVVPGQVENLRVSTRLDLAVAEALLARRRHG